MKLIINESTLAVESEHFLFDDSQLDTERTRTSETRITRQEDQLMSAQFNTRKGIWTDVFEVMLDV